MLNFTEEEEKVKWCRHCLINEHSLPVVLADVVIEFFKWDWPRVGEEVAALDANGDWWKAIVVKRTLDTATIHYFGWSQHDERHSRYPFSPDWVTKPLYNREGHQAMYNYMLPTADRDKDGAIIWATLRNPERFINAVGGTWRTYPMAGKNPEVKRIGQDPRTQQVKTIWRPDTRTL